MPKRTLWWSSVLLIVGLLIARLIWVQATKKSLVTAKISRQDIIESIEVSGNVQSAAEAPVGTTTTGIIADLYVTNGDPVTAGQNLFKVTSLATEQEKAAAYANYQAAKTALGTVQATQYSYQSTMFSKWKTFRDVAQSSTFENDDGTPKNNERTLPEFHTAQDDWLAAEAQYKNQDQAVSQAQAAVNSTYLAYQATQDSTVTAPLTGTVINLANAVGDKVTAATALTGPTPILTVANLSNLTIKVQINEEDIPKLRVGQKAAITLEALKDQSFSGTIVRLDTKGAKTDGVITYNGYIIFDSIDPIIRPMMTATVKIETIKKDQALTVPNISIQTDQGQPYLQVMSAGKLQSVPIEIGVKGLTDSEVLGAVSEGQDVVIPAS